METDKIMLPGVARLYWLDADHLPPFMMTEVAAGKDVALMTDLTPVAFCGTPTMERTTRIVNCKNVETVTLKFFTRMRIEELERMSNVGFVAVDANGRAWLLGSRIRPHCIMSHQLAVPAPGSQVGVSYEVRHTALTTPVRCSIFE